MQAAPLKKLFISYSRADVEWTRELREALEAEGFDCWMDEQRIEVGKKWWDEILAAVESCDFLLFILSSKSAVSGFCLEELKYASRLHVPIFPMRIEKDCPIPEIIKDIQVLEYSPRWLPVLKARLTALAEEIALGKHPRIAPDPDKRPEVPEDDILQWELKRPTTSHQRRREIGIRWEQADPRPGVGLRPDELPDIDWVEVEEADEVVVHLSGEQENPRFRIESFYIARYPITHVQFQAFVRHPLYEDARWGWGKDLRLTPLNNNAQHDNQPQVNVDWYHCVAFSRWLTATLPPDGWPAAALPAYGWELRLPTEWEWQLGATGNRPGYLYPWGADWNAQLCNSRESRLGSLVAVGLYPGGAAPCGALDMAGNVSEWCLNVFETIYNISTEAPAVHQRSYRGGSFNGTPEQVSALDRCMDIPRRRDPQLGFRLVCVPPKE